MISNVILTVPGFVHSPPTLVNKIVNKIPVPSDADGYVVNTTSNTHTVTQEVKGGSQNEMTLNSCNGDSYKTCTCTTEYNQFIKVTNDCRKYNYNI